MTQTQDPTQLARQSDAPPQDNGNGNPIARRVPIEEREVTYVPFQGTDKITLTVGMIVKFLCKPTKRGATCSPEHAVRFMMLCKARALNPWEGDAFLVGYDGQDGAEFNLITAHQAFLKRAEAHPEFEGMESGVMLMDENGVITEHAGDFVLPRMKLVGGWAKVHRRDRKIPIYRRLNIEVFAKPFGVWKGNPQGMIVKTSEADALRSSFPNSLAGMYVEAELEHTRQVESQVQTSTGSRVDVVAEEVKRKRLAEKVTPPLDSGHTFEPTPEALAEAAQAETQDPPADASTDAQDVVPASEKIEIPEPAPMLSHGALMQALAVAAVALNVSPTAQEDWLSQNMPAEKKKCDAILPPERMKKLHQFARDNGGVVVKAEVKP